MYKYILTLILILIFTACSKQPLEYSTKTYKDIDKNAVLNALKRVVKLSDEDFRVNSKRNSVEASKTNIIYKGFSPNIKTSKILLETSYEDKITKAILTITNTQDYNENKTTFASKDEYSFFWRRMDYILGLNEKWESCYSHMFTNEAILCDILYNQNNNASKKNIIKDTSIFVEKEIVEEDNNVITQIDLTILNDIQLPFEDMSSHKNDTINEDEFEIEVMEIDAPINDVMEVIKDIKKEEIESPLENNDMEIIEIQ